MDNPETGCVLDTAPHSLWLSLAEVRARMSDIPHPPPHGDSAYATVGMLNDQHDRQRRHTDETATLLRAEMRPLDVRLVAQEKDSASLRKWRHEDAEGRRMPWGTALSALGLVISLTIAGVAAWIASGQRLTRLEVRMDSLVTSVDSLADGITQRRDQRARDDAVLSGRLGGIEVMLRAYDERMRRLEHVRPSRSE